MAEWVMYAHEYPKGFMHIGSWKYVHLHMLADPIVEVVVREQEDGRYWGWMDSGKDRPTMIWPSEAQFRICFPYGPDAEEARGRGRILRLSVEAMPMGRLRAVAAADCRGVVPDCDCGHPGGRVDHQREVFGTPAVVSRCHHCDHDVLMWADRDLREMLCLAPR